MSGVELAQDGIEKAAEEIEQRLEREPARVPHARRAAVVIAALAAMLAIAETEAKDAQTAYLSDHIAASDTWAQYQAKSVRRTVLAQTAELLASLPTAADPALVARAAAARKDAERMRSEPGADGMEQLAARATGSEQARDHQMHRYHGLETASGGLQLAIVLVTVSVVTGTAALLLGGGILGLASAGYGLLSALSLL